MRARLALVVTAGIDLGLGAALLWGPGAGLLAIGVWALYADRWLER